MHGGFFPVRGKGPARFGRGESLDWFSHKGGLKMGGVKNPKRGIEKVTSDARHISTVR